MATTATPFYSLEFVMSHEPSVRSHSSHDGMSHEMGCPPPEHSPRDDMPLTEGTKQMDQSRSQSTLSSVPEKKGCESSLTARTRFAPPLASGSQSTLTPSLQLKGQSEGFPTGAEMQTQTQHDCSAYQMGLLRTTYARPLEAAASLLHTVDADLADELYRVLSLMDRLLTDTASVLTSMSCAAQAITTQTLPVLRAALAAPRTRRTAMATSIGIVLALVAEPQNGVAQVLHSYMLVVERVYYIHRCVGAALDGHFTEEGSSADAWQGLEAEKTGQVQCRVGPSGRGVGEALGGALRLLAHAAAHEPLARRRSRGRTQHPRAAAVGTKVHRSAARLRALRQLLGALLPAAAQLGPILPALLPNVLGRGPWAPASSQPGRR